MATNNTGEAQIPEANAPDDLSKKIFVITLVGAAAFIGVAIIFVVF